MAVDFSKLPPDLQAYIQEAVQKATQPPAPVELTPAEKLQAALETVKGEVGGEHNVRKLHEAISAALDALKEYVDAHQHGAQENS